MVGNKVGQVTAGDGLWWLITHFESKRPVLKLKDIWSFGSSHSLAKPAWPARPLSLAWSAIPLARIHCGFGAQTLVSIEGCFWDNAPGKHSKCQGPDTTLHPPFHHPFRTDHNSYPLSTLACFRLDFPLTD